MLASLMRWAWDAGFAPVARALLRPNAAVPASTPIREAQEKYQALFERSPAAIAVTDADGVLLEVNPAWERLTGRSRAQVLARRSIDFGMWADNAASTALHEQLDRDGFIDNVETRFVRADRVEIDVLLSARRLRVGGEVRRVWTWNDVTQSRRLSQALAESNERFRALTALSSDWYWEQDAELRFVSVSSGFTALTGIACDVGLRRWEIDGLEPLEGDWGPHRAEVEARRPFRDLQLRRRMADGETLYFSASGRPVFDAAGRFAGYRGTGRDRTARKRAERVLQLEHNVTRSLAQAERRDEALREVMREICAAGEWECGIFWRVDQEADVLRFGDAWHRPDADLAGFIAESSVAVYLRGEGLAGRVWQSGEPLWSASIEHDARVRYSAPSRRAGIHGAILLPLVGEGEVLGVLAFSSRALRKPDARLLQAFRVIGSQIGQYLRRKLKEEALAASEARFRSLTALSSDFFWEQDAEYRYTRVEGQCWMPDRRGEPHPFLGKTRWELGMEIEDGWAAHRTLLEGRLPFHEAVNRRAMPDGSTRIYSVSGEPVFDTDGAFVGYRGVGREVTAEKLAEQRLRLEHAVARALAGANDATEGLRETMRVVCESENWECGRYFSADAREGLLRFDSGWAVDDPAFGRFLAGSRHMVMRRGEGLAGCVWDSGEPIWVKDAVADRRLYARALARECGTHSAATFPVKAAGRVIGVLSFSTRATREPDGRLVEAMGVICSQLGQFLQRKAAEQALRASEERFRSLSELSSDFYWEQDEQYRFVQRIGAGLQAPGFPRDDVIGRTRWELEVPNLSAEDWARHRADLDARREFRDLVMARPGADGELHYFSISGEPVFDGGGGFRGYRGVGKDITDRVRAEEVVRRANERLEQTVRERTAQLEEANRDLESYNYSISHDLRQPLTAIAGFAELLHDRTGGEMPAEWLAEIESNVERMTRMIESLLRFSHAGRAALRKSKVDANQVVDTVLHDLSASGGLKAEVQVGELPPAAGDPVLLRQVWLNLIGNALKYSGRSAGPRVEIGGERKPGLVEYSVRDNGVGFDMQRAERLFVAFQRLPSSAGFSGSGIGLAIVERIVRRHGGSISAESSPGKGATFRFTLPDSAMT